MNNYEKIKSMSVDELAKWLVRNTCYYCSYQKVDCDNKDCKDGIKQWLLAEVEK